MKIKTSKSWRIHMSVPSLRKERRVMMLANRIWFQSSSAQQGEDGETKWKRRKGYMYQQCFQCFPVAFNFALSPQWQKCHPESTRNRLPLLCKNMWQIKQQGKRWGLKYVKFCCYSLWTHPVPRFVEKLNGIWNLPSGFSTLVSLIEKQIPLWLRAFY